MKIFWSPLAFERLQEIFNYISREDISAARKLIEKIFQKIETIVKNPIEEE